MGSPARIQSSFCIHAIQTQCKACARLSVTPPLVKPEQLQRYRSIGVQLAQFCQARDQRELSAASLQAAIADLAADQATLLIPLRDLISRMDLRSVWPLSNRAQAQALRDGLLQDLRATYAPAVVEALGEVLNGLLDLPASHDPVVTAVATPTPRQRSAGRSQSATASRQGIRSQKPANTRALITFGVITALLLSSGAIALRQTALCQMVGLCPTETVDEDVQNSFATAVAAELALRRAGSLPEYRRALEQLEEQVLRLRDASLTAQQRQQWKTLDETALAARRNLAAETADIDKLELAAAAITRLAALQGSARDQEAALARQYLDAIPASSFSATEANSWRQRLDQILSKPPEATTNAAGETRTAPPPAPPTPDPVPASPPAPTTAP